ncbi:AsmA-like C-terminal region-containing protein [Aquabacter sp. CN5-332]|uniref:AsmA family protein n=1 Tax=Aquabacter sp. CN5-332 TaxID=3156608 RepID=UPI0032B5ECC6
MQGILITVATAVIVAIVAAFAAPFVVDWTMWRSTFESEASRTLGVPVLIRGPIEAELLPVPRVTLRAVTVGADNVSTGGTVDELRAEFALGALLRGNLEAHAVTLVRPHLRVVVDSAGRVAAPTGTAVGYGLTVERLAIAGGQLDLVDRGADRTVRVSGLDLRGEARSLTGPFRLEGEGEAGGQRYNVRLSLGKIAEEGARLRLTAEARGRSLVVDLDGLYRTDRGTPRFEGKGSLVRQAAATKGADAAWRLSATVRLSPEALVAEGVDLSIGDEARPVQLGGAARLSLGRALGLDAVLNARALDADTLFSSTAGARTPADAVAGLAGVFASLPVPDIASRIGVAVDQLTVGGTVVRDARLDFTGGPSGWRIDTAEAKLPGQSAVRLSGAPARANGGSAFEGDIAFSSEEPATFLRWAAPKAPSDYASAVNGPVRFSARISTRDDRFAADNIKASFGAARATGSAALHPGVPARLDVALNAEGFDLDPVIAAARMALAASGGVVEGGVTLDGRNLRLSGLPLGTLSLQATGSAGVWTLSRLSVTDLAGLKLDGTGRFERLSDPIQGQLALSIAGAKADGLVPLARLVAGAEAADTLLRLQPVASPVKLSSTATWAEGGGGSFSADGVLGLLSGRITVARTKAGTPEKVQIAVSATDAARVLEAVGLPGFKPGQGAGRLDLTLQPAPGGGAAFEGRLALADGAASGNGAVRFGADGSLSPRIKGEVQSADLSRVLVAVAAMDAGAVPAALTFDLSREDSRWRLDDLKGSLAGGPVTGSVALEPGPQPRLTGTLGVETLSLPRLVGLWGARSTGPDVGNGAWSAARFALNAPPPASVALDLTARRIELSGAYGLTDGRLRLVSEAQSLEVRDLTGAIGGGHLTGAMTLRRRPDALAAEGRIALDNVDAAALLAPLGARTPPAGHISLSLDLVGAGRSPQLLAQSLSGQGTIGVQGLEIPGADPSAIQLVLADTTAGTPPDERRTAEMFDRALLRGQLKLDQVETAFGMINGVARLSPARGQAGAVRATFNGSFDPVRLLLDTSLELEAAETSGAEAGGTITWRGPAANPERRVTAAPLASVIAMRAIERETRRLEERQGFGTDTGGAGAPPAGTAAAPAVQPAPVQPAAVRPAAPAPTEPARASTPSAPARQSEPRQSEPRQSEPRPVETRPVEARQAPPLAPPQEIAPSVRPRAARPDSEPPPYRAPATGGFGYVPRPPGMVPGE